jgi:hypothetical protein
MLSNKTNNIPTKQLRNLLSDSALLLAILTTILYCIGTSHFYGLLNGLNTDPNLIERSFHQIIYYGALTLLNTTATFVLYVSVVLMTLYVATAIGLLEFNWTFRRKRRLVRLRRRIRRIPIPQNNLLRHSTVVCLVFMMAIGCLIFFQSAGHQQALRFISELEDKNNDNPEKITVRLDSMEVELFRVACGTTRCLGVEANKMQVRVFEKNAVLYTKIISK